MSDRRRKDFAQNTCSECPAVGIPLIKGMCRPCRSRFHYQNLSEDQKQKRRENSRTWNIENREQFNQNQKQSRLNHLDERREKDRIYNQTHKEERALARKQYRQDNAHLIRVRTYGLSEESFANMLGEQNSCCAICKEEKRLVIDHSHRRGRVRQLICYRCNVVVGLIESTPDFQLQSTVEYIQRHEFSDDGPIVRKHLNGFYRWPAIDLSGDAACLVNGALF